MEFRIFVTELSKVLGLLQTVVQKKNTIPILSNILVQAASQNGAGTITLSATDLDVGMRLTLSCEVLQPGSITVSAKTLLDIVKMLPGPEAILKVLPNQQVNVKSGRTNACLLALSSEEYPQLPDLGGVLFQTVKAKTFMDMVNKTIYCTSSDENRYNLTGVFYEPQTENPHKVTFVATDGHRLSKIGYDFENIDPSFHYPLILPRKGLMELLRLLDAQDNLDNLDIEMGFNKTQAFFKCRNAVVTMRLIDGKFPDYNQVIPKIADKILRASRIDLLTSLKRVSVLASDKNQSVKVASRRGEVTVSCFNPEAGEVSDDVPVEYNGPDIEIAFNARYMIEALSSLADQSVMIKLTDALSPTLLTGTNDDSHLCVIMPMRI